MKKNCLLVCGLFLVFSGVAYAQDATVIQRELDDIREDMKILQRKVYSDGQTSGKISGLEEQVRQTSGRFEELDYKIKQLEEKVDMLNRDIDIRIKMLEGKKIDTSSSVPAVDNTPKFSAPVASQAPLAITGGAISSNDDLQPVKGSSAEEIYQSGLEALKANNYANSEKAFSKLLAKYPNDKLAGNAQYWLGETYYARKEYEQSAVAFARGYQQYHSGAKAADSLLKLGKSMQALNKKKEACAAFLSLPKEFPKADKSLIAKAKSEATKSGCK